MSVTRSAFDAAVREAAKKGVAQPVIDSSGKIAYYVDQTGATVDAPKPNGQRYSDPTRAANPESSFGQMVGGGGLKATAAQQKAQVDQHAKQKAAQDAQTAAHQQAIDQANQQYIWLDGHRVKVTNIGMVKDPASGQMVQQYTFATDQDGYQATQNYNFPTAYAALDNPGVPAGNTQFLMSHGPMQTSTGRPGQASAVGKWGPYASDGSGLQPTVADGRNEMTIGNALQWLANLSVKDPNAYSSLVDRLHSAGYLGDSEYMAAGGSYSQGVARAFALAAQDTAVLNSTDPKGPGYNMTLDDLLNSKTSTLQDQARKARAAAYQPVQRTFTDPEEVKAAAKNAAQAAIGRDLTPDEQARLTSHFHSLEAQKFDAIDSAGRNGNNATVTDPSVGGQVQAFLDQNPQEEANYRAAQYGGALRQLFGLKG